MSTAEIKIDLISKITAITDKAVLEELVRLLRFQDDSSVYLTDEKEKLAVKEAREENAAGKTISDFDVRKESDRWLNS